MNHLKQHARDVDGLTHFLTYADNNAVGYFIKQVWVPFFAVILLVYAPLLASFWQKLFFPDYPIIQIIYIYKFGKDTFENQIVDYWVCII